MKKYEVEVFCEDAHIGTIEIKKAINEEWAIYIVKCMMNIKDDILVKSRYTLIAKEVK